MGKKRCMFPRVSSFITSTWFTLKLLKLHWTSASHPFLWTRRHQRGHQEYPGEIVNKVSALTHLWTAINCTLQGYQIVGFCSLHRTSGDCGCNNRKLYMTCHVEKSWELQGSNWNKQKRFFTPMSTKMGLSNLADYGPRPVPLSPPSGVPLSVMPETKSSPVVKP